MSVPTASERAAPKKQWLLRLLVLFFACLGALSTGLLGSITLSDLPKQREHVRRVASVRGATKATGQDADTVPQAWTDLNRQEVTAYFLLGASGFGMLCAYFTMVDRRGFLAGLLLLSAVAAIPILTLNQDTLLYASPLLLAGLLSLLVWRPRRAGSWWGPMVRTATVALVAIAILVTAAVGRSQPGLFVPGEPGAAAPVANRPGVPNKGERPSQPKRSPPAAETKPN